jgi:hypothetical protein
LVGGGAPVVSGGDGLNDDAKESTAKTMGLVASRISSWDRVRVPPEKLQAPVRCR